MATCTLRRLLAPLVLVSVFLSGCVSEPSAITGQKQRFGYTWQQEQQLGAEADKDIIQEMGLYENPAIQAYVESVGRRVLERSDLRDSTAPEIYRDTKFTFRVVNSPVVNAFALPGGYVYLTRGLLAHVQNEAQLAVVLGHEIAHVAARHASQQAVKAQWGQLGLIGAAILGSQVAGPAGGQLAENIMNMGGQAFQLLMMRYGRKAEYESDELGVKYAAQAGYATAESAKFFTSLQRITAAEGKALPTWQSTHPDPGDRAQKVLQMSGAYLPVGSAPAPAVGEEEYLRRLEGLVVGDNPREGFTQNGIFYHPDLRFQFPVAPGWKLQNESALVAMLEPGKTAIMTFQIAPGATAREAAQQFAEKSGIQVAGANEVSINGMPAMVVVGQGQTEQGPVGVWSTFIQMDGKVYNFMGYAPAQAFAQHVRTFEGVAGGFAPLRDPNILSVQPARMALVPANRTAPFREFVPPVLPQGMSADSLAIMNQVALDEPVQAGRLLKLPALPAYGANSPAQIQVSPAPAGGGGWFNRR